MEDKRKLTAAIIGAVAAFIQTEKQPPPTAPGDKPETRASKGKIPGDRSR
ncbi:hypothetical protein ES703_30098 [subsurface metagenome]